MKPVTIESGGGGYDETYTVRPLDYCVAISQCAPLLRAPDGEYRLTRKASKRLRKALKAAEQELH